MRARVGLVAAAFLLAASGCAARAETTTSARNCAASGATVLASDHREQVYSAGGSVYGCEGTSGRRTRLGSKTLCIGSARVDRVALAGHLVAYGLDRCGVDTGSTTVVVRRLSDGKQLRSFPAVTGPGLVESYQSINSLVVTTKRAVAWIATDSSIIGHGTRIEVHANNRLLDSGAGIDRSSLRLRGSTLTWRHGGATRSATL